MSRIESERRMLGEQRWPRLQCFVSQSLAEVLGADTKILSQALRAALPGIAIQIRTEIAEECWDFMEYFKDRYDEWSFLRDAFDVRGGRPADDRGRGHSGLARVKLTYDAFAESIRAELPNWQIRSKLVSAPRTTPDHC